MLKDQLFKTSGLLLDNCMAPRARKVLGTFEKQGPEILPVLEIKVQVLHRVQIHHFNQQIHHFNHILKDAAPKALNSLGDDYVTYLK